MFSRQKIQFLIPLRDTQFKHPLIFKFTGKFCFHFNLVCSLKLFFKKLIMGFCRYDHSEQLFPLELLLKMRSYSSGNRRIFGKMSGIFAPFSKDFLRFSKIGLYLTPKNAISCHIRQKIEKMAR